MTLWVILTILLMLIKKVGFQGLRRVKNRSILVYVRILNSSVTQKSPFLINIIECGQGIV